MLELLHLPEIPSTRVALALWIDAQDHLVVNQFSYRPSYRRNLPHIQPPGATFFLTFRLAGSLPKAVIRQWNKERQWLSHLAETNVAHYEGVKDDFARAWFRKFEGLLDNPTQGPVWLADERVASIVAESFHHRDGRWAVESYDQGYVITKNGSASLLTC